MSTAQFLADGIKQLATLWKKYANSHTFVVLISAESGEYEESYNYLKWTSQFAQNFPTNLIKSARYHLLFVIHS